MDITELLAFSAKQRASDLHLSAGLPPMIRVDGDVRRINVAGNDRTRDEVVRREFRQLESAWYDGERIKLSRDRLKRLGYFKDVNIETQEVPGSFDQVDLLVKVEEKPLGSLQLGAGFSSAEPGEVYLILPACLLHLPSAQYLFGLAFLQHWTRCRP